MASESHGGEDVPIYASGPMSHLIHGVKEQHYVGHVMQYASCVGRYSDNCDRRVTNPYVTCSKGYGLIYNKSVLYISLSIVLLLMFY